MMAQQKIPYMAVLENDSGQKQAKGALEGRGLEYDIHTGPDAKNPNGQPVDGQGKTITEHLDPPMPGGKKETSESNTGQFNDVLGRNGDRTKSGVWSTTRYFTLSVNGKDLGRIPIMDATGIHYSDTIRVNMSNGAVQLNGRFDRIDVP